MRKNIQTYFLALFIYIGSLFSTPSCTLDSPATVTLETNFVSPTQRYLSKVSIEKILESMERAGLSTADRGVYEKLIDRETPGFIGYHGGCSEYRLFQDLIRLVVEELLEIPIREDFHFLRIPGDNKYDLHNHARSFLNEAGPQLDDHHPEINQYIISLNIALFQSHEEAVELTPRYYTENRPCNSPDYWAKLRPFVEDSGIKWADFEGIIQLGMSLLPRDKGILLQFFDRTGEYHLLDSHFYPSHTRGKPFSAANPSHFVASPTVTDFPQLRLVVNNSVILNPHSSLAICRYDALTEEQRSLYEKTLRTALRRLHIDKEKLESMKQKLLLCWSSFS